MKKQYLFSILTMLFIVAIGCSSSKPAAAEPPRRWETVGSVKVNYRLDHDVLNVSSRNVYRQLQISVKGGSLNMYRAVVFFENGGKQEIDLRQNFNRGSASRVIDLQGNRRRIEKISLWYDTKDRSRRKAVVTVLGK